jgi:hypothetical protein
MAPAQIRDVFANEPVSGVGGFIEVAWPDAVQSQHETLERLHIREWEIDHQYRNVELPMSGGFGSIQRRRVADDFRFATIVDFDLRLPRVHGVGNNLKQPFYDGKLEGGISSDPARGGFLISMEFHIGDPGFWINPGTAPIATETPQVFDGPHYRCNSVILDRVITLNSCNPPKAVRCVIEGHGSSPLRRYIGSEWLGAGAFGFSQALQGQTEREKGL